jgi:hypothetical protein
VVTPDRIALVLLLALPLALTLRHLPYYALGRAGRVRDPLHTVLDPATPFGLTFGFIGLGLFLFMWLYPMRKRVPGLRKMGGIGSWLRIHVIAGIALPILVAVHAGWRFTGLIGLGYFAMVLVTLSGFVGRYVYARIPRHRNGVELSRDEVMNERRNLLTQIASQTGLDPAEVESALSMGPAQNQRLGLAQIFVQMFLSDLKQRRALHAIRRNWSRPRPGSPPPDPAALKKAMQLARRQLALDQQVSMLEATHRVFSWWHVAHLPVAITALVAVLLHVIIAVLMGGVGRS